MSDPSPPEAKPAPAEPRRSILALTIACVLALVGLAVTVLHLAWPSPLMFTLFMVVGQGSFAAAMAVYLAVILVDLRRRKVL
ncbi:MAG: hypothetical protein HY716_05835 [Planctomycetes bacterium]|nr:hypothetical protein [Planctomycetota bacterium]